MSTAGAGVGTTPIPRRKPSIGASPTRVRHSTWPARRRASRNSSIATSSNSVGSRPRSTNQSLRHAINRKIGRAPCRERVWQYVEISVVAVSLKKKKRRRKNVSKYYENEQTKRTKDKREV